MKKIIYVGYMVTLCALASDVVSSKELVEGVCSSPACESLAVLSTGSRVVGVFPEVPRWQATRRRYTQEEIRASEQRSRERIKRALSASK